MPSQTSESTGHSAWLTVERVGAFSDGVIAIIITLLVLEIQVPEGHDFEAEGMISFLLKALRDIMVYLLNFGLIFTFWLQHHVMFHYIGRADRNLLYLNALFLFSLSLSPFATSVAATYRGIPVAEAVFGFSFLLAGLALLAVWLYAAARPELLVRQLDRAMIRSVGDRVLLAIAVIILGIAVSAVNFHLSAMVYFCVPLLYLRNPRADAGWKTGQTGG